MFLPDDPDRWQLTWSNAGWLKLVTITDRLTGARGTGRDWGSWEAACRAAEEDLWRQLYEGASR